MYLTFIAVGFHLASGWVTILPLIERELRVRARGRVLYWTRFAAALVGMFLCLPMISNPTGLPTNLAVLGHTAFLGIVTAAFISCSCAGFLTVDAISRERREGTLGLLCLTRVTPVDFLLGSFGASGITCLCALTAFLPILMLPVLAGGVTGGEVFPTMLVLLDTLLLSLAAGLWASAGARDWRQGTRQAAIILLVIYVVPIFPMAFPILLPHFDLLSPLTAFRMAGEAAYFVSPAQCWMSLLMIHGASWLLLLAAGLRLHRAMREGTETGRTSLAAGSEPTKKCKPIADAEDPIRWLVRRQHGITALVWAGALIGLALQSGPQTFLRNKFHIRATMLRTSGMILPLLVLQVCVYSWAASRFFVEARRTGELELLQTSPAGAKTIISSQWAELKRVFLRPIIILVATSVVFAVVNLADYLDTMPPYRNFFIMNEVVNYGSDVIHAVFVAGAAIWTGLWFGPRAPTQTSVIIRSVLYVRGVPYVVSIFYSMVTRLFGAISVTLSPSYFIPTAIWEVGIVFYFVWLIRWARRRLAAELTEASASPLGLAQPFSEIGAALKALIIKARQWPPAPEK